jgi:hypothetical protein
MNYPSSPPATLPNPGHDRTGVVRLSARRTEVSVVLPTEDDGLSRSRSMPENARQGLATSGESSRARSSLSRTVPLPPACHSVRVAAQHNRSLLSPHFRHRTEGEDTPPPREETATADDDLVRVFSVPLVADVIQPADVRAVAREHPVAPGDGEEPAEFRLCPVAPLPPATLLHGREE